MSKLYNNRGYFWTFEAPLLRELAEGEEVKLEELLRVDVADKFFQFTIKTSNPAGAAMLLC